MTESTRWMLPVVSSSMSVCGGPAAGPRGFLHAGGVGRVPDIPDQAFQQRGRRRSSTWVPSVSCVALFLAQTLLAAAGHGWVFRAYAAEWTFLQQYVLLELASIASKSSIKVWECHNSADGRLGLHKHAHLRPCHRHRPVQWAQALHRIW